MLNHDFSDNGADFNNPGDPNNNGSGYVGQTGNPSSITDFTLAGGGGIEFQGDNPPYGPNFAPSSYKSAGDPTYFAFLQFGGSSLTQTIDLTAGKIYTLSFESAPRNSNGALADTGVGEILSTNGLVNASVAANTVQYSDFSVSSIRFYATGGDEKLVLANTSPSGDNSVDFGNVMLVNTPEPSTYALLGLGVLALALVSRRAARNA